MLNSGELGLELLEQSVDIRLGTLQRFHLISVIESLMLELRGRLFLLQCITRRHVLLLVGVHLICGRVHDVFYVLIITVIRSSLNSDAWLSHDILICNRGAGSIVVTTQTAATVVLVSTCCRMVNCHAIHHDHVVCIKFAGHCFHV